MSRKRNRDADRFNSSITQSSPRLRRLATLCLALVATSVALCLLWPYWQASQHWRQAEHAIEQRDFSVAIEHLRQYVRIYPHLSQGKFQLARTLRRNGEYPEAATLLNDCDWVPDLVELEKKLLDVQQHGTHGPNREILKALVYTRHPQERLMLEAMAVGDRQVTDLFQAGTWLNIWIDHFPDDWLPRQWRAELRESFKHFDLAREDFLKLLELQPDRTETLQQLGKLELADRADFELAEKYFRQVLEREPNHAKAWLGVARCRHGLGDLTGALAAGEKAAQLQSSLGEAPLLLAAVELEGDHPEQSRRWLERAASTDANPQVLHYQFAQTLRRLGREEEAKSHEETFQRVSKLTDELEAVLTLLVKYPDKPQHRLDAGKIYEALGKYAMAERWYLGCLQLDPKYRPAHEALAELYDQSPAAKIQAQAEKHRHLATELKDLSTTTAVAPN